MLRPRIIPCLLLRNQGLVKTVRFKDPTYVGDPINAVKIFNEKGVDELVFLDITATSEKRSPPFTLLKQIASECFMPLGYGGGIRTVDDVRQIFNLGVEKVIINSYAVENPGFIKEISDIFGSQSVVVSIDVKRSAIFKKYEVCTHGGRKNTKLNPVQFAKEMENVGAGELLLNSIDRDGTMEGYDLDLIKSVVSAVDIPVVASGGAGKNEDFGSAIRGVGASAAAAGSMFVFQGRHRAVLINYPTWSEITQVLK